MEKWQYTDLLRQMLLIRRFEEKAAEMYMRGKIGVFCISTSERKLSPSDPSQHCNPRTTSSATTVSTATPWPGAWSPDGSWPSSSGRSGGTSKGKGGSMHLFNADLGFLGGYAIVGGMMPIAVGLGLRGSTPGQR